MSSQRERKLAADRELTRNRPIVFARDEHCCAAAGDSAWSCAGPPTLQHRRNRGAGGSTRMNGPQWLLTLCQRHNEQLESDATFAEIGRQSGWKLRAGEDPLRVAVWYRPFGQWRLLDADGEYQRVTARDEIDREQPEDGPLALWRGPKK